MKSETGHSFLFSKMAEQVNLLGAWRSPYVCRVMWTLKLKGIPYEFTEENLSNKSPLLLQSNPVYKKVPVLLHEGKPICESMLIVEYIEETWPQNPLLPSDPYDRAVARFWIKFVEDNIATIWKIYRTTGEEQEKAVKESLEILNTIEEHAFADGNDKKFFGGDKIGMVDIAIGPIAHWTEVVAETGGVKLELHKFPRLHAWSMNFKEEAVIKEDLPDSVKMLHIFKSMREKKLTSASA